MKYLIITIIIVLTFLPGITSAEISGGLSIGLLADDIEGGSTGLNVLLFNEKHAIGRFNWGWDLGLEMVERYLFNTTDMYSNIIIYELVPGVSDTDSVAWFNKDYREYLFFPMGLIFRYDPMKKSMEIDPGNFYISLFLGLGGSLSIRQSNGKQTQIYYDVPGDTLAPPYYSALVNLGGESIATFDFYIKPKIAFYWQRVYFSYEFYFLSKYFRQSFDVGYVFRL